MAITPREFIKNMGAGYNLGNMYECFNFTKATEFWRYWQYGTFSYKVMDGSTEIVGNNFTVVSKGKEVETKMTFTFPDTSANIVISHNKYTLTKAMKFVIKSAKVNGSIVAPTKSTFTTTTSGSTQVFTINASDLSASASGKSVEITFTVDINALEQYPTSNNTVLSEARTFYATAPIDSWGNRRLKEAHILAIWEAGFRSIRMPITWTGRCDVGTNGHVTIDAEFFAHIDSILAMLHTPAHPFNVFINVHHDDGESGWLQTDAYVDDVEVRNRYADYWTQIANHFKNYDYWLTFGTNNETLNSVKAWEGASVTKKDIYGLVTFQQVAHDIIRSSGGKNADRIVLYPTYAAKRGAMGSTYQNPSDSSDTGTWHIPYESDGSIDPYGICEIHPYNSYIGSVKEDNQKARAYGYPVIYGEYGVSSSQLNDEATCISQAYIVSYATWAGMGTYLWDDFGNMKLLNKDECTLTNSRDFNRLWVGYAHNFIPSLTASATLKEVDIGLTNRRTKMCLGDKTKVLLNSTQKVTLTQESGSSVTIDGNELTTGGLGKSKILAISYTGEYNDIDIDVVQYQNTIDTEYSSGWENNSYSEWDSWKVTVSDANASLFIPVNGGDTIKFVNTSNSNALRVREYNANKSLITWGDKAYSLANGASRAVQPNCAYVGVTFNRTKVGSVYEEPLAGTKVLVSSRDFNIPENGFETEGRVANISNYNKYSASIFRTIDVIGGVDYTLHIGSDCNVNIIEYGNDGTTIKSNNWYTDGEEFTTNLFTKKIRFEIAIQGDTYADIIEKFNSKEIEPKLYYSDFSDAEPPKYNETSPIIDVVVPTLGEKFLTLDGKIVKYKDKIVRY